MQGATVCVALDAGWVREMYAWCAAVHKNGINIIHQAPPKSKLISQPPHDSKQGEACMLHYTWGTLYHKNGKEFWRFDKRDWTAKEHELKVSGTCSKAAVVRAHPLAFQMLYRQQACEAKSGTIRERFDCSLSINSVDQELKG